MTDADIALVGSGYWGKNLARVLHERGHLALVCDSAAKTADAIAGQYGVPAVTDLDDALSTNGISATVIATPAATHFDLVSRALMAGKDVFVEKPLALHVSEAQELQRIASAQNRILMVGHLLQYHPVFLKLKSLVDEGSLGRLRFISSHRLNLGKIRQKENILWSFAPHDISMILSLVGALPEKITAMGAPYLHAGIADITTTAMEFPDGVRANVFVSWLHPFKEQKLVVVGEKQMAVFDDTKPWEEKLVLYPHKIALENGILVPFKADPCPVTMETGEPLGAEIDHFIECCVSRANPRTDGEEGIRVLKVLTAAQRSMDMGRSCGTDENEGG